MKTAEIQSAITLAKQLAREWKETGSSDDFTTFVKSLDGIVAATVRTIPPTIRVQEVEVIREKVLIKEVPVETIREVEVVKEVVVPTLVTQEILIPPATDY